MRRYPAIVWSLLGGLAALAVKYVPGLAGLDVADVADFLALAITAATGVVIHRKVRPDTDDPEK